MSANLVKHAGRHRAARYLIVSGVANLCAILVPAVTHAEPLSEFRARLVSGPALSDAERQETQRLAPNAPQDKPHSIKDRRSYEEAIAPYVAEARKTYPEAKRRFLQGLPRGHVFFVTTRLRDSQAHWEQVFVRVQSIRGDVVAGVISSQLSVVKGYATGQVYSFKEAELLDWLIAKPDGSEEGNVVGKFLDGFAH